MCAQYTIQSAAHASDIKLIPSDIWSIVFLLPTRVSASLKSIPKCKQDPAIEFPVFLLRRAPRLKLLVKLMFLTKRIERIVYMVTAIK